jgi:hypothetical protein
MEGRNYLEQLQFKKQAKKPPTINIEFGNKTDKTNKPKIAPKPKVLESGEELEEGEVLSTEEIVEPIGEKRKAIQMQDLRGKVPVDYELIMKRLQTHNITGVVDMVSKKPEVIITNTIVTIPKRITKTIVKTIIEDDESSSSEKTSSKSSSSSDSEPAVDYPEIEKQFEEVPPLPTVKEVEAEAPIPIEPEVVQKKNSSPQEKEDCYKRTIT